MPDFLTTTLPGRRAASTCIRSDIQAETSGQRLAEDTVGVERRSCQHFLERAERVGVDAALAQIGPCARELLLLEVAQRIADAGRDLYDCRRDLRRDHLDRQKPVEPPAGICGRHDV